MLKIIEAHEPIRVETIVLTFYSPPGIGKTSLAFSSEKPLLLDTDAGVHRSAFRKTAVRPVAWDDIGRIERGDVEGFKTLILDTSGRALDLLAQDIMKNDPKRGKGGSLDLKGYGILKTRFADWLKMVRSFGLDVILVAHSEEKVSGDEIVEKLDMQGGSKQEVFKCSDAMARLGIVNGQRMLSFSPTETQFGKDPANIGRIEVPDLAKKPDFLAGVIHRIKESLNAQSDANAEEAERRNTWAEKVGAAKTAKAFNDLIPEAWDDKSKRVLWDRALASEFTWHATKQCFISTKPEPKPEPVPEPEAEAVVAGQQPLPF